MVDPIAGIRESLDPDHPADDVLEIDGVLEEPAIPVGIIQLAQDFAVPTDLAERIVAPAIERMRTSMRFEHRSQDAAGVAGDVNGSDSGVDLHRQSPGRIHHHDRTARPDVPPCCA